MKNLAIIVALFFIVGSCKKNELNSATKWTYQLSKVKHSFIATNKELVLRHNREMIDLSGGINWFVTIPSAANLVKAKNDWIQSFNQYNLIKPFLLFDKEGLQQINIDFDRIELSSLDPSYIDYTASNVNSGIIMHTIGYPNIYYQDIPTWDLHNNIGNESKITLGYHVIEFLLWGEDLSSTSGGLRSNNDYLSNNNINNRRRAFLRSVTTHLEVDNSFVNLSSTYENRILEMDSEKFAKAVFTGLTRFIDQDLSGNTLYKPYISQNPNDELSPFSDNTKSDIFSKLNAIKYFLNGRDLLEDHNDYFFEDFLKEVDSEKYEQIQGALSECFTIYNSISGSFDNAINPASSERAKVYALYSALMSISKTLKEIQSKIEL